MSQFSAYNPKSLTDLDDIPEIFQKTVMGDKFVIYDSNDNGDLEEGRVLVFATRQNLNYLCKSSVVSGRYIESN